MSNEVKTQTGQAPASAAQSERKKGKKKLSAELSILIILIGIAALFEVVGWIVKGESFLFNPQRLFIIVLQVSIVGLLAIAVTQVIITGGIDLSSGSVLALSAVVAASLAQTTENTRAVYPALTNLPFVLPLLAGVLVGCLAGIVNGTLIARTGIPPFIATLGTVGIANSSARERFCCISRSSTCCPQRARRRGRTISWSTMGWPVSLMLWGRCSQCSLWQHGRPSHAENSQ